jgi:hypothetical protein
MDLNETPIASSKTAKLKVERRLARNVQFALGVEMMGNKMSISSRDAEIEIYDWGVRAISKKSKKVIRIYSANIKGVEEIA